MKDVDYDVVKEAVLEALGSENEDYTYPITEGCHLSYLGGEGFWGIGVKLTITEGEDSEIEDYPFAMFIDRISDVFTDGEDILHNICMEIIAHVQDYSNS